MKICLESRNSETRLKYFTYQSFILNQIENLSQILYKYTLNFHLYWQTKQLLINRVLESSYG